MDKILPRKYNNAVVIGLGIGLAVAMGVCVYLYMRKPTPVLVPVPNPAQPSRPEHVETHIDGAKPALVLIWAEWCGPSKQFKPTWDKVAGILNKEGAIDAIEISDGKNKGEIDKLRASGALNGFPSVKFYPHGYSHNSQSVAYEGNRTEEDVLQFAYKLYGS